MEKTKSFDEKVRLLEQREWRAKKFFSYIEAGLIGLILINIFLCWELAFGIFFFLLWTEYWYTHGRDKWVTDEYEKGGYPTEGLKAMFISWAFLIVLGGIIVFFCV